MSTGCHGVSLSLIMSPLVSLSLLESRYVYWVSWCLLESHGVSLSLKVSPLVSLSVL